MMTAREKMGLDPIHPSDEHDTRGRSITDEEFEFTSYDGSVNTINVIDTALYLIDYDIMQNMPAMYNDFIQNFKLPDILPGGDACMMNSVS